MANTLPSNTKTAKIITQLKQKEDKWICQYATRPNQMYRELLCLLEIAHHC